MARSSRLFEFLKVEGVKKGPDFEEFLVPCLSRGKGILRSWSYYYFIFLRGFVEGFYIYEGRFSLVDFF